METNQIRINKYLTVANFCSRREADKLILANKVRVNGVLAKLGQMVTDNDDVEVNGKRIQLGVKPVYLAYNKPVGVICTTDTSKKDNIIEAINFLQRIYPIGRLDVASSGLILLTNDGSVVNKILKSAMAVEKEYVVKLDRDLDKNDAHKLRRGVVIDGIKTKPANVNMKSEQSAVVTITEGRNRQVRRMFEVLGYTVKSLRRVRIGDFDLGDLKIGEYKEIDFKSVVKLA